MRRAPVAPVPAQAIDPFARVPGLATLGMALLLSVAFAALIIPWLDAMPWEYDEGTYMLMARAILRGEVPFVDFFYHQPPLHLYLLAAWGKLFGQTVFVYRLLSVASIGLSGVLLFVIIRPFCGPLPALVAQAIFLFSPSQVHALAAVAEVPMVTAILLGAALLFVGERRWSAYAAGVAFVAAILIKPTCLPMVAAAALSLVYARDWRRLGDLALAGVVAAVAGLAWTMWLSDGIFTEILRFQALERIGTRAGMWSIDSGFHELRRATGVETPAQWAWVSFKDYQLLPETPLPLVLFVLGLSGMAAWVLRCARRAPAVRAFAVLWPLSCVLLNFVIMDYVSAKYFGPFIAFTAFLLAGLLSVAQRAVPPLVAGAVGLVVCGALAGYFVTIVAPRADPWFYGRADWISRQYPAVAAFTPMFFAATGTEPGCGMVNPAHTYGGYGDTLLTPDRTRRFQFTDARLVDCLRANPSMPMVVDFWFYYFTRPGSALRAYLDAEGSAQRLYFSPLALEQWGQPQLTLSFVNR